MPQPTSYQAKGSALQITIASTLTTVPGLENIKVNPGEGKTFENADLDSDYEQPMPSGLIGEGSFSCDCIWNPVSTVHQKVHAAWNAQTNIVSNFLWGATAKPSACSLVFTKVEITAEKGGGLKAAIEGKITTKIVLNES